MDESIKLIEQAHLLIYRLERLSADSIWAHRSSGYRGSLLKLLEKSETTLINDENQLSTSEFEHLRELVAIGYQLLENAAREYVL
jgi:hypothetical protein